MRPEPAKLKSRKPNIRLGVRLLAKFSRRFKFPVTKQAPATEPMDVPANVGLKASGDQSI